MDFVYSRPVPPTLAASGHVALTFSFTEIIGNGLWLLGHPPDRAQKTTSGCCYIQRGKWEHLLFQEVLRTVVVGLPHSAPCVTGQLTKISNLARCPLPAPLLVPDLSLKSSWRQTLEFRAGQPLSLSCVTLSLRGQLHYQEHLQETSEAFTAINPRPGLLTCPAISKPSPVLDRQGSTGQTENNRLEGAT